MVEAVQTQLRVALREVVEAVEDPVLIPRVMRAVAAMMPRKVLLELNLLKTTVALVVDAC